MKPGDEIMFEGKTYVAAEAELIGLLMGFDFKKGWGRLCNYCTDACQIGKGQCARVLYRVATGDESLSTCIEDDPTVYLFLKPEQPITGESK